MYRVVSLVKTVQQINHSVNEGTAGPDHFGCMMEMTNGGPQLTLVAPMQGVQELIKV